MAKVWNKGLTKETSTSVRKISETMRRKGIDNFSAWRTQMKKDGKIKSVYPPLNKDGDLAELIGVILGDGNIYRFPRTEALRIVGNSAHQGFVNRYARIVGVVFKKKPHVAKRKSSNASNITLYEKNISKRLRIPTGSKQDLQIIVPRWISTKEEYVCRYLRGLYESDGSHSVHEPTYTHKFIFSNKNQSLLNTVFRLVKKLGFHPHMSKYAVQVSRKDEVRKLKNLLQFRSY